MKITIIGWYGTETIGDRAILAGIISFLSSAFNNFEVKLGSLYPFFTERTLKEDYPFFTKLSKESLKIELFNSKKINELKNAIKSTDVLIMGGGPLMDLSTLYMVEYAFKLAKKRKKKTAIIGCGIGPLFKKKYQKTVLRILEHSDLIVLRDNKSKENLDEFILKFKKNITLNPRYTSLDPAIQAVLKYKYFPETKEAKENNYIGVNLRAFPNEYSKNLIANRINENLYNFISSLADSYKNKDIKLIPMHYFHIGNDDRMFLNKLALEIKKPNLVVQNSNLNLEETFEVFQNAYINIGMRFHSVLFQTLLNGKNYILDYTEPNKGKISGFIRDIDHSGFYRARHVSLQKEKPTIEILKNETEKFYPDEKSLYKKLGIYSEKLKEICQ